MMTREPAALRSLSLLSVANLSSPGKCRHHYHYDDHDDGNHDLDHHRHHHQVSVNTNVIIIITNKRNSDNFHHCDTQGRETCS